MLRSDDQSCSTHMDPCDSAPAAGNPHSESLAIWIPRIQHLDPDSDVVAADYCGQLISFYTGFRSVSPRGDSMTWIPLFLGIRRRWLVLDRWIRGWGKNDQHPKFGSESGGIQDPESGGEFQTTFMECLGMPRNQQQTRASLALLLYYESSLWWNGSSRFQKGQVKRPTDLMVLMG